MYLYCRATLAKQLYWTKRTELAMELWNRRKDNGGRVVNELFK